MLTNSEREHLNLMTQRILTLDQQVQFLMSHLGITMTSERVPNLDEVAALLKAGDKLGAIKRYRVLTNTDLAEAKTAVEKLGVTLGFI